MKFKLPLAAALCAGALVLTGCGGASAGDDGGGPVKLTFQSLAFQDSTVTATKDIVDTWNTAHPDIQVSIIQSNYDDVHDQLVTQFQSNTAPDLIYDEASDIAGFANQGYLADLSPHLTEQLKAAISPEMMKTVTIDGKVVATPTLVQSYVAFANPAAFKKAGVAVPEGSSLSWDQLRTLSAKLAVDGQYGIGWGLKQPASAMMNTAMGYGGTFFDVQADGAANIHVGDNELAVPRHVRAMLQDDKSMNPTAATQSTSDVIPSFLAGKEAIYIGASYLAQQLTEAAPKGFDLKVLPPLAGSAGIAQAANPQTLSIAAQSKHQDQAAQFLDFYMNADNQARLAQSDWLRPVSQDAVKVLQKKTAGSPIWPGLIAATDGLVAAPFTQTLNYPQWKLQYATPGLQKYFAGSLDDQQLTEFWTNGWTTIGR